MSLIPPLGGRQLGLIFFLASGCREVWEEGKKPYLKLVGLWTSKQYRVHTVLVRGFSVLFVKRKGWTPRKKAGPLRLRLIGRKTRRNMEPRGVGGAGDP